MTMNNISISGGLSFFKAILQNASRCSNFTNVAQALAGNFIELFNSHFSRIFERFVKIYYQIESTKEFLFQKRFNEKLTHLFPMYNFSIPWNPYGFLMFSGGRERVH